MEIKDYGEWTFVTYDNGKTEYIPKLIEVQFCKKYIWYYKGITVAHVNLETGFIMGTAKGLYKSLHIRNEIETGGITLNTSDFLKKELEYVKQKEQSDDIV